MYVPRIDKKHDLLNHAFETRAQLFKIVSKLPPFDVKRRRLQACKVRFLIKIDYTMNVFQLASREIPFLAQTFKYKGLNSSKLFFRE